MIHPVTNTIPPVTAVANGQARSSSVESSAESKVNSDVNHQEQVNKKVETEQLTRDKTAQILREEKQKEAEEQEAREEEVDDTVTEINQSIQGIQRNLAFSVDKDLDQIVINVIDKKTDEVIRQIPSEEFLELARNLQGMVESKEIESASSKSLGAFLNAKT